MKRIFLSLVALTMLCACQKSIESEEARQLDSLCRQLFPADEPGAAVLVVKGDTILFDRGYGLADLNTRKPIDGNTFFNIASISKQFTAVAILQLVDEGKLSLNDAVAQYFAFPYALWKEVWIRHLLSQSSGVPDLRGDIPLEEKLHATDSLAIAYMPTVKELHFLSGSEYEYMNPTFVLLGALVGKISGQPFSDYMQEHIFAPAGMQAYYIADGEDRIPNLAHGYEYDDETADSTGIFKNWYEYDLGEETFFATRPDGGLYTSAHEFLKWEKALRKQLPDGELKSPSADLLRQAWTPQTKVTGSIWSKYQNRHNTWYGYGWFIEPATDSTKTVIYHTGDNGGFKALAARYPEDDALVLVFANRSDWNRYGLKQQIEKLFRLN